MQIKYEKEMGRGKKTRDVRDFSVVARRFDDDIDSGAGGVGGGPGYTYLSPVTPQGRREKISLFIMVYPSAPQAPFGRMIRREFFNFQKRSRCSTDLVFRTSFPSSSQTAMILMTSDTSAQKATRRVSTQPWSSSSSSPSSSLY